MRSLPQIVIGLAVAVALPGLAADSGGPGGGDGRPRFEGLPPAPGAIGPLRRDESGRIVPFERPAGRSPDNRQPGDDRRHRAIDDAPDTGAGRRIITGRPIDRFQIGDTSRLERLQDGGDAARHAEAVQREIDSVLGGKAPGRGPQVVQKASGLSGREAALLKDLERRHATVVAHERAVYFAAIPHARAPQYWYVTGPAQRRFAVAGITRFDLAPVAGNREATLQKFLMLRRAALAPDDPSDRDRAVAAELDRLISGLRRR